MSPTVPPISTNIKSQSAISFVIKDFISSVT